MTLIWHEGAEIVQCICGEILNGKHECDEVLLLLLTKIIVTSCNFNKSSRDFNLACSICRKDDAVKKFNKQWKVDEDGYSRCAKCFMHCDHGITCECCEMW